MSLINNMLKDLDKRKQQGVQIPFVTIAEENRKSFSLPVKPTLTVLLLASALLLLILAVKHWHKPTNEVVKMLPAATTIEEKSATNSDLTWIKPVSINGVTLQVKDNITELTFMLSHAALYRIISDDIHNQVTLVVDHAELLTELPSATTTTAIQHVSSKNTQGDMYFTLTLYPGAAVKYVNLTNDNKNPELVIAIENTPTERTASTSSTTNLIKTPAMHDVLARQYQNALRSAQNGQYQVAINDLSSLIKMDPEFKSARVSLVALLMDQGKLNKATQILNDGLRISPDNIPLIELKARMLTNEGKVKEALALLQSAQPTITENPEYYAFLATLYERNNNDTIAINLYRKLIELNTHNGSWWFGMAVSLDKLGRLQEAADAYTNAVSEGNLSSASIVYLQKRLQSLQETKNEVG